MNKEIKNLNHENEKFINNSLMNDNENLNKNKDLINEVGHLKLLLKDNEKYYFKNLEQIESTLTNLKLSNKQFQDENA